MPGEADVGVPEVVERGRDLGQLQGEVPLAGPGGQLVLQLRQRAPALDRVGPVRGAADPVQQTLDQLSVLLLEHLLVRGPASDDGHQVLHVQDPGEHDGVLVHQQVLLLLAELLAGGEPVRLVLELLNLPRDLATILRQGAQQQLQKYFQDGTHSPVSPGTF